MTEEGKAGRAFFDSAIAPRLGAAREDVRLGPTYGVDFGVADVGGCALVAATDPVSILPSLGLDRAARFAVHIALADVAVSGLPPTHLAIGFHLPPEMSREEFETVWTAIHEECLDLGTAVLTGHTGWYEDCRYPWVGAATVLAVGDHDEVVRPDGARPGDRLLITKGPAVESTALLAHLFGDRVDLDEATLDRARDLLERATPVRDALAAAAAGPVTAMHDATERGIDYALHELAGAAGVAIELDRDAVPVDPTVDAVCEAFDVDPWTAGSAGTLLLTVRPDGVDDVLAALDEEGIDVAAAGVVHEGEGVIADGEPVPVPERDAFASVYADLGGQE